MRDTKRASRVLIVGVILSTLLGIGGGLAGGWLGGAPFYFGFFCTFTLAGLITLFWLAAVLADTSG